MVQIRPMIQSDLVTQYGFEFPYSVRGFAAEHNGDIVGVAGIMYSKPPQCFSRIDSVMKSFPRSVVVAVKVIRELLNRQTVPVYATPDEDEPTANTFLKHVGFKETELTGVWKWDQQQ